MKNGLLQSAKVRLGIFVVTIMAVVVVVAAIWHHYRVKETYQGTATVVSAPSIDNVPGAGNPSDNYVQTQNRENAVAAQQARKDLTSSIPTITRASFNGDASDFTDADSGVFPVQGGASDTVSKECPTSKVVYLYRPNPANCSVPNLKLARQAGVTAEELRCQACSCPALRAAGYTAGELKDTGYGADDLKTCGYELQQLIDAGFSAKDLKAAGFTAQQLRNAGFSAGQLAAAGFTAGQLKAAGYSNTEIENAGVKDDPDCDIAALKQAHAQGVSGALLKKCGVAALKAAGYSAAELKAAGFSAKDLKEAGFSAAELKAGGFSASDLKNAGFSDAALKAAGYTAQQIQAANSQNTGICSVEKLRAARESGASPVELKNLGCSLAAMKAAGFTAAELRAAGFSAKDLKDAGFSAKELHDAGFSAADLKAAGFSAADLKKAGYDAAQLKDAGFSAAELRGAGFSAADLKEAGFSAAQLRNAGYSAAELKNAGFSASALKNAGFSAGDLKAAGYSAAELKNAGFSAQQLRNAGFGAAELKAAGFSAKQLKDVGFTGGDLLRAGYSANEAGLVQNNPSTEQQPLLPAAQQNNVSANNNDAIPSIDGNPRATQIRELQEAQQRMMSQQQKQDAMQQMQNQMLLVSTKIMAGWSNPSVQTVQRAPEPTQTTNSGNTKADNALKGPTIKAGTIMFGVLDTSVNSDENTPVMATIVSGQLKNAKLVGRFTRVDKKLLLNFNLVNVPSFEKSFGANIVAIDPDTAHTALAGYVNNHYLLRYGSLFASAFLSGISQGIMQTGTTQSCFGPFCVTSRKNNFTPTEYAMLGVGQVGQQYSNTMSSNFNVPPTVKIPGGVGIGLLFMSDVTLPEPLPQKNLYGVRAINFGDTDSNDDLGGE